MTLESGEEALGVPIENPGSLKTFLEEHPGIPQPDGIAQYTAKLALFQKFVGPRPELALEQGSKPGPIPLPLTPTEHQTILITQ